MIIAVDFDGTLVEHEFPAIGAEVPGAFEVLRDLQRAGVKLILWTMRSDSQKTGAVLTQAIDYCLLRGVKFWGINSNPDQGSWTCSPKAYAQVYIDDAAVGCPLVTNMKSDGRPYVDWRVVRRSLEESEIL